MREIKFKAWDKTDKFMTDPFYLGSLNAGDGYDDKWIILQFTGLKDTNGTDIYEGDIVKASIYSDETPSVLEVRFHKGCFEIDYEDSESDVVPIGWFAGSLEVTGNVFENPELLN